MIRSFDWRDLGLVRTLAERGICLDSETALTQGTHPLQDALLAYLMPMAGAPTFVWRADGNHHAAYGQLQHHPGDEHARVLFMAPVAGAEAGKGWLPVVERLAHEAGERRAQNLLAEVNEKSLEFDTLREAGFAIYARQSIWKLAADSPGPAVTQLLPLRAAVRGDALAVSLLYSNIVPRLVQQVEPGPRRIERGYVLEDGGELVAYLDVRRGPQGLWVEPFLHPEADDLTEAVLSAFLQTGPSRRERPLYVCVRRYQSWLQEVVAHMGLEALGPQAVLVKRLAVRAAEPLRAALPVVEGHVPSPITSAQVRPYDEGRQRAPHLRVNGSYRRRTHAEAHHRRSGSVDAGHPDPCL